jgi:agmatine deiminase
MKQRGPRRAENKDALDIPAKLRFRMPAEWEPHEATWIAWPHEVTDWPGKFAAIVLVYVEIVRHLHRSEAVRILVNNHEMEQRARTMLLRGGIDLHRIEFFRFASDRVWVRDYGPIFLKRPAGSVGLTDWKFNAWAKYPNWKHDNAIPAKIGKALGLERWEPAFNSHRVVLEGGSIDVNGTGLLLTTEECLLSSVQARNPGLSRTDLEQVLRDYLGVGKVLWLERGIAGDDTHGHVDDIARFVGPKTVVAASEPNQEDANHLPLSENLHRLKATTDLTGEPLVIFELPMPAPLYFSGQRLPASYANFYIANKCVLVPTFNDPADRVALGLLADLFPGRTVIGIHSVDLVWGLGTLHCLTLQQPARGS